jgi:diguanylate cyclase (GGDEF)-like protein
MKPNWKRIYPQVKTAVLNLDSVESLLQQTVERIAATYRSECLLWAGLEAGVADALRVYTTSETANKYAASLGFAYPPTPLLPERGLFQKDVLPTVQQFCPRSLPAWLLDQQQSPQLMQLETGELIVPITSRGSYTESQQREQLSIANPLQFVLQLGRSLAEPSAPEPLLANGSGPDPHSSPQSALPATSPIQGWSLEELESIEVVCSQLGLAYSALYWRQRLEQSRQQSALVGRISHLLNSTLNPDELVGRIVAELGLGLQCDRSILVDLRHDPVSILAVWNHPERNLESLEHRQIHQDYWKSAIEMFIQGGASYLQIRQHDPNLDPLQPWLAGIGALSVLLVPLFIQEEFFGAVALLSYQGERTYLIDELQTVRQVADQAAIALTNAQHYQSLWHKQEALRVQNNSLQLEVLQDELTQLMNRRCLERELGQLSTGAVWTIQPFFCIIACDIDYFKLVNDTYGHLVGDEVLQEIAQRLQSQLRRGTQAYRYGGEEFVVILTDTPLEQAVDVAERLRRAISTTPMRTKAGLIEVTASFGVAQQHSTSDGSAWDVLRRADKALYEAKRQGRDRIHALEPF